MEENRVRLRVLLNLLGVTVAETSRLAGCSRSLLSRFINGDDVRAEGVFQRLEAKLPELVAKRTRTYFQLEPVQAEVVEEVARLSPSILQPALTTLSPIPAPATVRGWEADFAPRLDVYLELIRERHAKARYRTYTE
jgi:hypothetical protein